MADPKRLAAVHSHQRNSSRSGSGLQCCERRIRLRYVQRTVTLLFFAFISSWLPAQTATYHLHKEASTINTSFDQLKTVGPDAASVALTTVLTNKNPGEYLIKEFETQTNVPNSPGVIPTGSTLTFSLWMRLTATGGTVFPRAKVRLNNATGTLLCTATGTTALTTTITQQNISCTTTANITMAATDRFYLWVGGNVTVKSSNTYSEELDIEGTLNGNYDSQIVLPLATGAPTISSLTPNTGAVGSSIVIAGTNYRSSQGSSIVTFTSGKTATPTAWSSTSITAAVPTGAITGNVNVTVGGQVSAGVNFTVTAAPSISSLTPNTGAVGSSIVIAGSNFGPSQGNGGVTFNGTAATTISSWSATSITATVPTGATTGNVVVTAAGGVQSNGVSFTVTAAPSISSLTPSTGAVGSSIVIAGSNFGPSQGNGSVKFNGTAATTISSWSATSITATVPTGATTGNVVVTAAGLVQSNGVNFTVTPAPNISSLTPNTGAVGSSIVIAGSNFGPSQGNGGVTFNGTAATTISSWSATSITATVPTGATTGNVVVTAAGGVQSNGVNFTVLVPPNITGLNPTSGEPVAIVIISGSNFGTATGTVKLNGQVSAINSWTNSSISFSVPNGATSGNVVVTTQPGLQSNGVAFTVQAPTITSLNPTSGSPGASVTISGNYFEGGGTVTFNGQTASTSNWSDSSITATVPSGATTGNVVVSAGGLQSNGVAFTVAPIITSLTPSTGEPGASITIAGKNFTSTQGTVSFNGQSATISSWSNTSISVTVPNGVSSGYVVVTAGTLSSSANSSWFGVLRPAIASITPTAGNSGTSVTISGNYFGSTAGSVTFNGLTASITTWSDTSIVANVPGSATTGNIVVSNGGLQSNGLNFTVGPSITSLSPGTGAPGTGVTIGGLNFGSVIGTVTFNNLGAAISSWANTSIATTVPNTVTTGPLVVTLPGGATRSAPEFVVPTVNGIWSETDIGTVGGAGSTSVSSGAYTVSAYSGRLGGTADSLHYVYQPVNGDFDMIAHATVITSSDGVFQYGITVRSSQATGAFSFSCVGQFNGGGAAAWRDTLNGAGTDSATGIPSNPVWLRIKRYANTFVCFYSTDGTTWTQLQNTHTIAMGPVNLAGMSVMSDNLTLAQVKFDSVSLTSQNGALPSPWLQQDVGAVVAPGDATYNNGVFTVSSNSYGFYNSGGTAANSDTMHYVYQPVTGDFDFRAHWQQVFGDGYMQAGVMMRQSVDSTDLQIACTAQPGASSSMDIAIRSVVGQTNQNTSNPGASNPSWVRLTRNGSLFDCYTSADGNTWTQGNSFELNVASTVYVGLVQPDRLGRVTVATFDNVSLTGLPSLPGPWQQQEIGNVTGPGDASVSNGVFTVESNSFDISGSSDNLHYVYQQAGGDLNITARVTWQQYVNLGSKAGVMVRQSLASSDLGFSCLVGVSGGIYAEWRTSSGGTDQIAQTSSSSPFWLKINRSGNTFTCYFSTNGSTWTTFQTANISMTSDVYVGLAQSSNDGSYSLVAFDNITLQANLPTVSITYPVNGSTVYLSQPVVLTATANPSPGAAVTSVSYYEGQTLLSQAVSPPYSVNIGVPSRGNHTYTAQVTDSAGLQGISVADTATMSNPQITSVSPDHGKAGTQIRVFGVGFGTSAAGVVLSVNGVPAQMTGFGSGEIDGIVPSGFDPGNGAGVGVGFPGGVPADGGPAFGPCTPNSICVTSLALSPTTVVADGTQTVTGTATMSGPPILYTYSGNVWGATIISPFWGNSFTCVSPAILGGGDMLLSGCASPTPSFDFVLGAPNTTNSSTTTVRVYYGCGFGGCSDPGVTEQVTIVGTGQAGGDPDSGRCTTCPTAEAGQPINLKTGNTYIQTTDYSLPGLGGGISITRTWNSRWKNTGPLVQAGMFGDSWRATYEDRIQTTSTGVNYWLDDGKVWRFSLNNGVYTINSPVDAHATLTYDSTAQQYTLTFVNGTKKIFSSAGYLTQVVDRNSNSATLTYDGSNRLTQILDAGGRTLSFAYADAGNPNQVTSISDAVGTIATYTYGTSSRLTNVTYADNSQLNYAYDANGLITSVTDSLGKVLESHTYDGQRRGITSQLANGVEAVTVSYPQPGVSITLDSGSHSSTYNYSQIGEKNFIGSVSGPGCASCGIRGFNQYTYDSSGNVIASFDSNGVPTLYSYDGNGNVTSRSTPINNHLVTSNYTYNSFGELLTATDPLGNVTTNAYDPNGNLLTSTTPAPDGQTAASVTTFTYDPKGQLLTITDPLNHVTTLAYYSTGLLHTITDAQNNVTTFNYDARGNRTDVYDAFTPSNHTSFEYDGRNRLKIIHNPDTSNVSFAYDTRGRRTSVTDGNGKITGYAYDDADRLITVTDANNHVTQYGYDLENNLTDITDANLHNTHFDYDTQGHLTKTTFPSTKFETYSYDNVGNLMSKTDRKNQTISYAYDTLNRLISKAYPDSTAVTYAYDDASRLTQVQDPTGTYSFVFDNMGRVKQTTTAYSFVSGNPFTIVYGYDKASNRTTMTDPNNGVTTYSYDTLNRLSNILDFNSNNFGFGYDALSRRTQLTRPNGINTNYSYDSVSNLLSVLHQQGVNTLDGATYTYDFAGNRTSKTNRLNGAVSNFSYDSAYQLTGVTGPNPESYTYDPVGNRLTSQTVSNYAYNSSNELTTAGSATYTYDDNGNTRTKTDGTGITTYNWDFENRLVSVQLPNSSTVSFKYDPFGRRIQKNGTSTTNYVYDAANVIEEVDQSNNLLSRYSQDSGIDEPLSELRSGAVSYYAQDGLGSVTSLSGTGGALANSYAYDSFGNLTSSSGTITNPYQYSGRDYDPETGLRYYRARYYDPAVGRFLSEDPLGFDASVDFYAYVDNDPTNADDPEGLRKVKVCRQPVESFRSKDHTYIKITDDDGNVLTDPEKHLQLTYGILGEHRGSKKHQQVKKGDPRNYGTDCKDVTPCDEAQIDALIFGLEWAWLTHYCPSCEKNYRGWFPTLHGIDGYNSNTFVFNVLFQTGMTPPPEFEKNAPGYRKAKGLWNPIILTYLTWN